MRGQTHHQAIPPAMRPAAASMANKANRFARGWKIAAIADAVIPRCRTRRMDYEQRGKLYTSGHRELKSRAEFGRIPKINHVSIAAKWLSPYAEILHAGNDD